MTITDHDYCGQSHTHTVTSNMFCAEPHPNANDRRKDACKGDSGGPFAVRVRILGKNAVSTSLIISRWHADVHGQSAGAAPGNDKKT